MNKRRITEDDLTNDVRKINSILRDFTHDEDNGYFFVNYSKDGLMVNAKMTGSHLETMVLALLDDEDAAKVIFETGSRHLKKNFGKYFKNDN